VRKKSKAPPIYTRETNSNVPVTKIVPLVGNYHFCVTPLVKGNIHERSFSSLNQIPKSTTKIIEALKGKGFFAKNIINVINRNKKTHPRIRVREQSIEKKIKCIRSTSCNSCCIEGLLLKNRTCSTVPCNAQATRNMDTLKITAAFNQPK